jgi:hypothetical protein
VRTAERRGGGGGVVGFVQRHLPLRREARWGGDPPTPPLSLRGPSGGCCARHPAGLWRTVAFESQHAGTGGCLHNMTSESGAAEARAAERTGARRADDASGSGRGNGAERWRGEVTSTRPPVLPPPTPRAHTQPSRRQHHARSCCLASGADRTRGVQRDEDPRTETCTRYSCTGVEPGGVGSDPGHVTY